jgi:hypothetical protein
MLAMMLSKRKRALYACAAIAMIGAGASWAVDSVLDDLDGGTNQNLFGAYWYFYDDCEDGGNSRITSAAQLDETVCGKGKYEFLPADGEGRGGTGGARLAYEFGETEPSCGTACTYGNMVGIGTMTAPEGNVLDITGATTITYWAKASAAMTVRVEVATSVVTNFAYHRVEHEITTEWAQYTINLLDQGIEFKQPDWCKEKDLVDFDPSKVEKIQWQVSADYADNPASATLLLDDIVVNDYEFVPADRCDECLIAAGSWGGAVDGWLLSDFDGRVAQKNNLGYYWYCYNDAAGRNVSDPSEYTNIFGGVTENELDPAKPILYVEGNGYAENGAFIEFQLGPSYEQAGNVILPFAGIGAMLSDNLGTSFYDAVSSGATGIYFDYKTSGSGDIRLEIKANKEYGNAGIVHYIKLKGADGEWQGAKVPFSKLMLPDWEDVALIPDKSLKLSALEKVQWAFQSSPGTENSIAIDNVGFIGATEPNNAVINMARRTGGFSIRQAGPKLYFSMPKADAVRVNIVSPAGAVVMTKNVSGSASGQYLVDMEAATMASGVYFVELVNAATGASVYNAKMNVMK